MEHMSWIVKTSTIADGNMSLRYGEQAEVLKNRQRFLEKFGLSPQHCVVMNSNHDDIVSIIDDKKTKDDFSANPLIPADTLITQKKNVTLLLTTADCLPVSLFDPVTETISLIHLSRHTFVLDLLEKTLTSLATLGVKNKNLKVVIGPHIHSRSYCFPLPLNEEPTKLQPYIQKFDNRACVDLTQATIDTLTSLGAKPSNIAVSPIDTYTSKNHFSHVRSVKNNEPEGRIITATCLTD